MGINIEGKNVIKRYIGSTEITKVCKGTELIYQYDDRNPFTLRFNVSDISEPLTLPVSKDYEVEWGDSVTTTTGNQHSYSSIGVYTVKMFGVVDDFAFNNGGDKDKLLTVEDWGGLQFVLEGIFEGCINLSSVATLTKTNENATFKFLFRFCNISNNDFSNWDTSKVISLYAMFPGNVNFEGIGLNTWDVSNVVSFNRVFNGCGVAFNTSLSNWDTSKGEDFFRMFRDATSFNQDISNFDFRNAKNISEFMFGKTSADYDYQFYDNLLNKLAFGDPITGEGKLDFTKLTDFTTSFGTIQYNLAGAARDFLVSQLLVITDGGQIPTFELTYNIASNNEVLTLPVTKYYPVDWGDGTTSDDSNQHLYATLGVYTVKMLGVVDDFRYGGSGDKDKLLTVEQPGGFVGVNGQEFRGCSNLTSANLSGVNWAGSIRQSFNDCEALVFLDLTGCNVGSSMRLSFNDTFVLSNIVGLEDLDTSGVVNFDQTLRDTRLLNQDVSAWDYSNAVSLSSFMSGKTAANYDYQYLDNLYNKWAFGDPITGEGKLDFTKLTVLGTNLGTIQYSSAGVAARALLVSQGLIIVDGGQNAF